MWEVWKVFPEIKPVLRALAASPKDISEKHMLVIERFAILLYNRRPDNRQRSKTRAVLKKVNR